MSYKGFKGSCNNCGERGHKRFQCPKGKGRNNNTNTRNNPKYNNNYNQNNNKETRGIKQEMNDPTVIAATTNIPSRLVGRNGCI